MRPILSLGIERPIAQRPWRPGNVVYSWLASAFLSCGDGWSDRYFCRRTKRTPSLENISPKCRSNTEPRWLSGALGAKDIGIARIRLNATDLGTVWWPPLRVDVSRAVEPSEDELEVEGVNSSRNRLVGDRELSEDKRLTRAHITVTEN
jgi:hypothetical protein